MKKIRLVPPGELLLKEFMKPNGLSIYRVAKDSGIAQPTLQLIVTGKRTITAGGQMPSSFGFRFVPFFEKEVLQDCAAFGFADAGGDVAFVV
jgi:hypothetical protein